VGTDFVTREIDIWGKAQSSINLGYKKSMDHASRVRFFFFFL
jgi:hypothetical protein